MAPKTRRRCSRCAFVRRVACPNTRGTCHGCMIGARISLCRHSRSCSPSFLSSPMGSPPQLNAFAALTEAERTALRGQNTPLVPLTAAEILLLSSGSGGEESTQQRLEEEATNKHSKVSAASAGRRLQQSSPATLPAQLDWVANLPPVANQGSCGSCYVRCIHRPHSSLLMPRAIIAAPEVAAFLSASGLWRVDTAGGCNLNRLQFHTRAAVYGACADRTFRLINTVARSPAFLAP